MQYEEALKIGRQRVEQAAEAMRRWTGVATMAVCCVAPGRLPGGWRPVGEDSLKEIIRDDRAGQGGKYDLVVVDKQGSVKACTRERYALDEVLRLAGRLRLPVAMPGEGRLSREMAERERRAGVADAALHVEV